jgi:Spy/CpxP family protein refolding chaperone
MKFKNLSLIAGAFALSLTAVPFSVKAETASNAPVRLAQTQPTKPAQQSGGIQLTPDQQTKLEQIRLSVRKQIVEQVLTKEQRTQIQTAMQSGKTGPEAFQGLTLTQKQQTQLRQIMVTSQQQQEAILTPEQKTELARLRQQNSTPSTSAPKK